jgi:RNA polymerase sigma factor (TIGR02999 family)
MQVSIRHLGYSIVFLAAVVKGKRLEPVIWTERQKGPWRGGGVARSFPPMTSPAPGDVTALLAQVRAGDRSAFERILPLVYEELRRIARRQLSRERPGHTLDSVAVVNEAYLKMVDQSIAAANRAHFLGISARAMRAVLIDYARARNAEKRGGGAQVESLDENELLVSDERAEYLEELDDALTALSAENEEAGRVVECLYFGGLTNEETAEALEISVATVRRRWLFAKAWLQRELRGELQQ